MKRKLLILGGIIILSIVIVVLSKSIKIEKVENITNDSPIHKLSSEDVITQVLNNEREFIYNGGEVFLNNLVIDDATVKVNQYAFVDLDGDKDLELLAITDSYYGYYLILDFDNNIIYGYTVSINKIKSINSVGIIYNESNNSYQRIVFSKNKCKFYNVAYSLDGSYFINDKEVTIDEYNDYSNKFIETGYLKFRAYYFEWMSKKLVNEYSLEKYNSYDIKGKDFDFVFATDNEFTNFNNDYLNLLFNLYFIDSNNNTGIVSIKRIDNSMDDYLDTINNDKIICLYDEVTQYITYIYNHTNHYSVYYFKYYNKSIQYIGYHEDIDYYMIFDEDILNDL